MGRIILFYCKFNRYSSRHTKHIWPWMFIPRKWISRIIVFLIKIETKIEYNKIKSTRNYFELSLTVYTSEKKIINFVENGGTIAKVAHTFGIGIASIYRWLSRPKLSATKVKSRQIKLDWKELEKDVKQNP